MKKLNKRFETGAENLEAFLECTCPYIQCGCDNIYEQSSINTATQDGLRASTAWQALNIAR